MDRVHKQLAPLAVIRFTIGKRDNPDRPAVFAVTPIPGPFVFQTHMRTVVTTERFRSAIPGVPMPIWVKLPPMQRVFLIAVMNTRPPLPKMQADHRMKEVTGGLIFRLQQRVFFASHDGTDAQFLA